MDSLRYWVTEMHVDGFRFDLAATLAREFYDVDRLSAFFDLVQQDPVVARSSSSPSRGTSARAATRSATSRRCGPSGTASTATPCATSGAASPPASAEFACRFTGSADLYEHDGRSPHASINFVTAHDGFTLRDLVSYNEKHNEANGEGNRDGESTTGRGTAAPKVRPTTRRCWRCGHVSNAT